MAGAKSPAAEFVGDEDLSYDRNRYRGGPVQLDRAYRLMHLPLVNPRHPGVIGSSEDDGVHMGRFIAPRLSLVAFIDWDSFATSPAVAKMIDAVSRAPFSRKVDFASFNQRRDRLHFTLAPLRNEDEASRTCDVASKTLAFTVRVASLWAGATVNTGRLYLPVYPERRPQGSVIGALQARAGLRVSDFFGIGFFNLKDHLDGPESDALLRIVDRAWGMPIFDFEVRSLAVIETFDSLLLDYRIRRAVELSG